MKKKMSDKERKELLKKSLSSKMDKSAAAVSQGKFKGIFDPKKNVPVWRHGSGKHMFDIIPYLASEAHPDYDEDKPFEYKLMVPVHNRIGVAEDQYVCLAFWNEYCPICEEVRNLRLVGTEDEAKAIQAKERVLYNVIVRSDRKEEAKGIQVLNISSWFAEKNILAIAENPRTGKKVNFSHPEDGKTIAFNVTGKGQNIQMDGWRFVERDEPIPLDMIEEALTLEELLHHATVEEIEKSLYGGKIGKGSRDVEEDVEEDDEDEEPKPLKKSSKKRPEPEPEEDEDDEEEDEPTPPKKSSKKKAKPEPEPEEDDEEPEDEPEEDEEEEEKPKAKLKKKARPEPEEDEDDEEEEKPKAKAKGKKKKSDDDEDEDSTDCPADGTLGKDFETMGYCQTCHLWEKCEEENEKLRKNKKKGKK